MTVALVYGYLPTITPATVYAFALGCVSSLLFMYSFEIFRGTRRRLEGRRRPPDRAPAPAPARPGRHEHTRPRYNTAR